MKKFDDIEHFVFPLAQRVMLINDFVVRRDILDRLPVPLALKVGDEWVWMNRSAQQWLALSDSQRVVPMAQESPGSYGLSASLGAFDMRTDPVINLEGQIIGELAWSRHTFGDWVGEELAEAVLVAQDDRIVWANAVARQLFDIQDDSRWSGLTGLPSWQQICEKSGPWQLGMYQLRCRFVGEYVLAEYARNQAGQPEASLTLEEVASLVHEIRNPLAALSGYVEMAQMAVEGKGSDYYEQMMQEIDRMSRLTSDLMAISRLTVIHPAWTMLDTAVASAWLVASQGQKKKGRKNTFALIKSYAADQKVWADPDRLQQVLTNLINNAVEAMTKKGSQVEIFGDTTEDGARIRVRDDGPGIPHQNVDKLSTMRFTTKKSGNGLGLVIVRRIIQAHGGHLRITANPGTTVEFTLPRPR